jgi:hypothetical protein
MPPTATAPRMSSIWPRFACAMARRAPIPASAIMPPSLAAIKLRWESHTEFVTYAAFMPGLPPRPFDPSAGAIFADEWQRQAPGKRVAAVMIQVDFLPDDPAEIHAAPVVMVCGRQPGLGLGA